ncbi:hypothetical protein ACFVT2_04325 [Streptomyces sp. NPDC058000]|uniref:hypothetical protein n=1 Tax=Streptomyces sp. NPDC058000 TaxID=3346299 RepID=UPI0036EE8547
MLAEQQGSALIEFGYDSLGGRTLRRTPSGVESRWAYDAAGRPATLTSAGRGLRFGHDLAGREIHRLLGTAALSRTWDPVNRKTAQTLTSTSAPADADVPEAALRHRTCIHWASPGSQLAAHDAVSPGGGRQQLSDVMVTSSSWWLVRRLHCHGRIAWWAVASIRAGEGDSTVSRLWDFVLLAT